MRAAGFLPRSRNGMSVVALEDGKNIERPAAHLVPALGKAGGRLCGGEKRKGLIVKIEGGVDQPAGLVGKVAVKAVFKAINLLEPEETVQERIFPRPLPSVLAGGGKTIGLTRLHAGAAVIGKNRLRILAETLVKAAIRAGRTRLPPQGQGVFIQPFA
ncbi:Uncharacterised protein [Agrobacterium tumefaciens]|nr:Uncharacterised protein [Agrobacterium tumefaciens]